jgi:hypothetical protein
MLKITPKGLPMIGTDGNLRPPVAHAPDPSIGLHGTDALKPFQPDALSFIDRCSASMHHIGANDGPLSIEYRQRPRQRPGSHWRIPR